MTAKSHALSQEIRALLVARKQLLGRLLDVELSIRGILRGFGLKVGQVTRKTFEARIRELVTGQVTRLRCHSPKREPRPDSQGRGDQQKFAPETRRGLQRSLGHVLTSEDITDDMAQATLYGVAETYYGIGGVR
jgi:hypothetical protein